MTQLSQNALMLSDSEKEEMCRGLLAEFGVTNIKKTGKGELIHSCCLPFGQHKSGDRNPSASLNYQKLVYNCLGCQNSGGLMWFVAVCRGTSTDESRKWLNSNVIVQPTDLGSWLKYLDSVYVQERLVESYVMPQMSDAVLNPWLAIHPYLTEIRHIPEKTLMRFKIGFDPKDNRIVLPHFWKGKLVGWQKRRLVNDGTPKYQNSPDFPKDRTIYNFGADQKNVVVTESVLSVLSKIHLGHMEATFGASVTDRQLEWVRRHDRITLFFDSDEAGWSATESIVAKIGERVRMLFVVNNPYAADPADLDDNTYSELVAKAVPICDWHRPTELLEWKG